MVALDDIKDPELLRQIARLQNDELERVVGKLREARLRVAELEGKTSEEAQSELDILEKELEHTVSAATSKGKSERRPRGKSPRSPKKARTQFGPTPQPELPIQEIVHDLDEADKICPCCGEPLQPWAKQDEKSEVVSVTGVQYVLEKHVRRKYRCTCGGAVETADVLPRILSGGRYSDAFLIHTAVQKYDAHLPLNRQARLAKRSGLQVTRQTLWKQVLTLHQAFEPVLERLHLYLLTKDVLAADESRWPVLGHKGKKTKNWTTWVLVADDAVRHFIRDSRGLDHGQELLRGYRGALISDGYQVYKSLAASEGFVHAHCWSHARRYLIGAEDTAPDVATHLIDLVGKLFGIEHELNEKRATLSADELYAHTLEVRQDRAKPIVREIGERMTRIRALSQSPIAAAVRYFENQWKGLTVFLDHPQVPLTSNSAERELRGVVLGRNNHVGSRSVLGTQASAAHYSLVESAKLNDLDPGHYYQVLVERYHQGRTLPLPHELVLNLDPDEVVYPARPPPAQSELITTELN